MLASNLQFDFMSATAAKVALVSNTTALTCGIGCLPNASIVDFVGYGSTASSFEGSGPAPAVRLRGRGRT